MPGLSYNIWELVPRPGMEPRSRALGAVFAIGPPAKSLIMSLLILLLPLAYPSTPFVLWTPMGSQRVGHDWATDLIWSDLMHPQIKTQNPTVEPSVTALGCRLHLLCSVRLHTSIYHTEPWAHLLSTSSTRLSCSYTSQCPQGWLVESMNNISKTVIVDFYLVSSLRINTQDHMIKEQPDFYFYHLSSSCKDSLMFPKRKKNVNNSIRGWTFFLILAT